MKTEHLVARTFFLSVAHFDHHTHLRVAQGPDGSCLGCVALLRTLKSHPLTPCFIDHSLVCLTHFLPFCSTPPQSTSIALPMTGIRRSSCVTPHGGLQFGHLVESAPHTAYTTAYVCTEGGVMPKDAFEWLLARDGSHGTGCNASGTNVHCTFCGARRR